MNAALADFIGPDFIGKLADTQLGNGLETDAAALRANAHAWQQERRLLESLQHDVAELPTLRAANANLREELQAANDRLAEIRRQATVR